MSQITLYAVFHLNLAYSSIEEEQRAQVIERCYWPLLRLARSRNLPFGIEASGYTLEAASSLDPSWLDELGRLTTDGPCEFVGSGYAQVIGPLVPAEVNAANLRLGNETYERLLGEQPLIALVNEQAYSAGLVAHYCDAGYRGLFMEWDNPARWNPEWDPSLRYAPQVACGQRGERIGLIWNLSTAFQKLQRYAHGEIGLEEYLEYLRGHASRDPRAFPLYGSDAEVLGFRPGRYGTEPALEHDEWDHIEELFDRLADDPLFQIASPSEILAMSAIPGAGTALNLETSELPVPVKKQGKYNLTRWAITGRDDLGINTRCWRIYEAMRDSNPDDDEWRELCYLWCSDFRTHITATRWNRYLERMEAFEAKHAWRAPAEALAGGSGEMPCPTSASGGGRFLDVTTSALRVRLNLRRGLAMDGVWLAGADGPALVGTLPHGHFDDINMAADFYSGQLVCERIGQHKVTDLEPVEPKVRETEHSVVVAGIISTDLGPIAKRVEVFDDMPRIDIRYDFDWAKTGIGSLRLGHVTLVPESFERESLFYAVANGGTERERFSIDGRTIDHGAPVSMLVSASTGIGLTDGKFEFGDDRNTVRVEIDKTSAALIGLITYKTIGEKYFYRFTLSALEMDETRGAESPCGHVLPGSVRLTISFA